MEYRVEGGKPLIPHASDALTNADLAHSGHLSKGSSQLQPDISDVTGTPFVSRLGDSLSSVKTKKNGHRRRHGGRPVPE